MATHVSAEPLRIGAPPGPEPEELEALPVVFQGREWARVVRDTYGFEDRSLEESGDRLSLFRSRSPLLGHKLVSAVFNSYAGPAVGPGRSAAPLIEAAVRMAHRLQVDLLELKCLAPLPPALVEGLQLVRRDPYRLSLLRLDPRLDPEAGYGRKFRKHLRRSRRDVQAAGVRIAPETDRLAVADFHELLTRVYRDRHAMISQPRALFEALWERFVSLGRGELLGARDGDGELAAGLLFLEHRGVVSGCFGAIREDQREISLDAVMKDAAIRRYAEAGLSWFDFGVTSSAQPGVLFAKSRFGAAAVPLPSYVHLVRARRAPELDYARSYPRLRSLYRFVPLPVARALSASLVRYLN